MLATWNGDYPAATRRYRQLQALQPANTTIALDLAASVRGQEKRPTLLTPIDGTPRRTRTRPTFGWIWRRLNRGAVDASPSLRWTEMPDRFGESRAYSLVLAEVLAGAGRPTRAVDVLEPLWQQDPGSYEVNLARAIAFTMRRSIADARGTTSVRRLDPTSRETRNAERLARAMLGSSVEPGFTFYSDSDNLQVAQLHPLARSCLRAALGCRRDTQDTLFGQRRAAVSTVLPVVPRFTNRPGESSRKRSVD